MDRVPTSGDGGTRVVFFGTPEFAVPTLRRLAGRAAVDVALVVTQPDRPAGRGRRLQASPVKRAAAQLGIPVYQPASLRSAEARVPLEEAGADLFVVAAYGLIFGRRTLAIPRAGCLNVHASLLPRFRGASPVAAAILSGDARTGVSLMRMEEGLDTGPVAAAAALDISPADTTESLSKKLAELGAELAAHVVVPFARGEAPLSPQSAEGASVVRPLVKADGWIDWRESAVVCERRVRAMWAWPRAWTTLGGEPLQVHTATVVSGSARSTPGSVIVDQGRVVVGCGEGALELGVVQLPGGRPTPAPALAAGRRLAVGTVLGVEGVPEAPPPLITWLG